MNDPLADMDWHERIKGVIFEQIVHESPITTLHVTGRGGMHASLRVVFSGGGGGGDTQYVYMHSLIRLKP